MCYTRKIQENAKKKLKMPHIFSSPIYHTMLKIIFQHFQSFFPKHTYNKIDLRKESFKAIVMYILVFI